ncbi:MAG: hypothetical protein IBX43_05030 [Campylobacterales bacterium]|nr:hypothetical protein [Campylobacterales bacterium]
MKNELELALAKKKAEPIRLAMCRKDLLHYSRYIFETEYETPLLEAWYHQLLCNALQRVASGEVTRLIINIPPAYGKTEFAVRLFVSWFLGNAPKKRVIYTSYSDDLATKTPGEVKGLITSEAYKKVFPNASLGKKTADKEWYLESNGGMFSTTVGGGITGFHGNIVIIDDPMKAIEKNSKATRDLVTNFYKGSITSRLRKDDPNSAIIVIMQRLHEDDLVGYLLKEEADIWTHINLTGIEEEPHIYDFFDYHYSRAAHEPLNPHFEDAQKLERQKQVMKEDWYSQYMQDPRRIETGYVLDEDFVSVATWELSEDNKCISIDPAQSIKETSDNRAISLVGVALNDEKIELFNVYGTWYGKWSNEEFVRQIIEVMITNPGVPVFMESSGGGIITDQYLKKEIQKVNYQLKLDGRAIITNRVTLFNPKTKISKNQKIDQSVTCLKNHQIRFVVGGEGQEQVKLEYRGFHPEKDSKADDCMETIANVVVNAFVTAKAPSKNKTVSMGRDDVRKGRNKTSWRL